MISFNVKDKFVKNIVAKSLSSKLLKGHKGKTVGCYGVAKDREYDIMLPSNMKDAGPARLNMLIDFLSSKSLKVGVGCYWDQAAFYQFNVVGLGYSLRKNNALLASKVLAFFWLVINNEIEEFSEKPRDLTTEEYVPFQNNDKKKSNPFAVPDRELQMPDPAHGFRVLQEDIGPGVDLPPAVAFDDWRIENEDGESIMDRLKRTAPKNINNTWMAHPTDGIL